MLETDRLLGVGYSPILNIRGRAPGRPGVAWAPISSLIVVACQGPRTPLRSSRQVMGTCLHVDALRSKGGPIAAFVLGLV